MANVQQSFAFDAGQSDNHKATTQYTVECSPPLIVARPLCVCLWPQYVAEKQKNMMREAQE